MKKILIGLLICLISLTGCDSSKIVVGKVKSSQIVGGELDHPTTYVSIDGTTYKLDGAQFFQQGQIVKLKCYKGIYQYLLTPSCRLVG